MSVKIIADSTCDLSKELLERYDISVLPLHIVLGNKEYKDGLKISPDEIYQWSNKNNAAPKLLRHPFQMLWKFSTHI